MNVLRSLAFYVVFYGMSVFFVLAALTALPFGREPLRRVADSWSHFHRGCTRYLLRMEVRIEGQRPDGAVLYAIKHESFFEALDLPCTLDRPVPFAKAELFSIPLWGRVGRAYGLVPVAREEGARALRQMLGEARRLSAEGRPLVIFPEGTRVPHGQKPALRSGFAGLYKLLALPVIPVAVDSGPLYHRLWKRPGTITLRFGEPIPPGLSREEIEQRVWLAINELN